jgi:hypothetical protein
MRWCCLLFVDDDYDYDDRRSTSACGDGTSSSLLLRPRVRQRSTARGCAGGPSTPPPRHYPAAGEKRRAVCVRFSPPVTYGQLGPVPNALGRDGTGRDGRMEDGQRGAASLLVEREVVVQVPKRKVGGVPKSQARTRSGSREVRLGPLQYCNCTYVSCVGFRRQIGPYCTSR